MLDRLIDYVRVYQRTGDSSQTVGCDPPTMPTADYINKWVLFESDDASANTYDRGHSVSGT